MINENHNIILFDGVCNLCEASIQFIIKHDHKNYFHFASQTSNIGKELLKDYDLEEVDSIVFVSNTKAYIHSDAVLEVSKNLDGYSKHLYFFRYIPKVLRDAIYRFLAKYRYKVFGKKDSCMMPSNELKDRFLD
jgi:predicted DCC family thiol-disulfide oxidoreductase YuxK